MADCKWFRVIVLIVLQIFLFYSIYVNDILTASGKLSDAMKRSKTGEDKDKKPKTSSQDEDEDEDSGCCSFLNPFSLFSSDSDKEETMSESSSSLINTGTETSAYTVSSNDSGTYSYYNYDKVTASSSSESTRPSVSSPIFLGLFYHYQVYLDEMCRDYFSKSHQAGAFISFPLSDFHYLAVSGFLGFPVRQKDHLIYEALESILISNFNLDYRFYLISPKKYFSIYLGAGLGYQRLSWNYQNPVIIEIEEEEEKKVYNDGLSGFPVKMVLGINVLKIDYFYINLVQSLTRCWYYMYTEQGLENDVFNNETTYQIGLELFWGIDLSE